MFVLIKCFTSWFVLIDLVSPQSERWYRTESWFGLEILLTTVKEELKIWHKCPKTSFVFHTLPAIQTKSLNLLLLLNPQTYVLLFQLQHDSLYLGRFILLRWVPCPGSKTLGSKRLLGGEVNLSSLDVRGFQFLQSSLTTAINLVCSCYEYFCSKQGWHKTVNIP